MEQPAKIRLGLIMSAVIILATITILFGPIWPLLPVQAGATLPPRNKPVPTVAPPSDPGDNDDDDSSPVGAYIELHVQQAQADLWSEVQWQDSDGNWQNVEGWRGTPNSNGFWRWWVDAKDFGKGAFRWVVRNGPNAPVLGISEPFYLPSEANKVQRIEVSIKP